MSRKCCVCESSDRAEIENAILHMTSSGDGYTIEQIAKMYDVDIDQLKLHAMFHTPLVSAEDIEVSMRYNSALDEACVRGDSLVRRMRLRETDVLQEVTTEYLVTLKAVGRRIHRLIDVKDNAGDDEDQTYKMSKMLTRPVVDLYLGLGGELRQTVKTISDIERAINGPQNDTCSGLQALADAIKGSGDQ